MTRNACKVSLDNPTHVFHPGGTVSGTLEVPRTAARTPCLVLQGIATAQITFNDVLKVNRTVILWQSIPLQAATTAVTAPGPYELYSFTTAIPISSGHLPAQLPLKKSKDPYHPSDWDDDRGWPGKKNLAVPLPSTCRFGPRGLRTKSECWVEYAIGAYYLPVSEPQQKANLASDCLGSRPFWLLSLPPAPSKLSSGEDKPDYTLHEDKRLQFTTERLAARDGTKTSALQRMRSGLRPAASPAAAFLVKLTRPRLLRPGEKLQVWIELVPMEIDAVRHALARKDGKVPTATKIAMPDVVLKEAKVQLVSETSVRVGKSGLLRIPLEDDFEEVLLTLVQPPPVPKTTPKDKQSAPISTTNEGERRPPPLKWSADEFSTHLAAGNATPSWVDAEVPPSSTKASIGLSRKLCLGTALPTRLAPGFKSYNCSRKYKWTLNLDFECAGETHKVFWRFGDTILLPPSSDGGPLDWGRYELKPEKATLGQELLEMGLDAASIAWSVFGIVSNLI